MFQTRFFGVRGSIATPSPETAKVGGNTSCVEVRCGHDLLVLDAGTGLRALGMELIRQASPSQPVRLNLFLSHLHWDHIQGFPFFAPAFAPSSRIEVWGLGSNGPLSASVRAALDAQMQAPFFPVGLDALRADITFHDLAPGASTTLPGGARIGVGSCNHPNGCLAYRIDWNGRSLVYATDTEPAEPGLADRRIVDLARGADVLIFDAQYTAEEMPGRRGWGHSTAEDGVRIAQEAGVGHLVLFHHDPNRDDAAVARLERAAQALFPSTVAAREGMTLDLESLDLRRAA